MSDGTFRWRGKLYHVRGKVDGLLVCRFWMNFRRDWRYVVLDPEIELDLPVGSLDGVGVEQ